MRLLHLLYASPVRIYVLQGQGSVLFAAVCWGNRFSITDLRMAEQASVWMNTRDCALVYSNRDAVSQACLLAHWTTLGEKFQNVSQAFSSREACERRFEWSPEGRVLWWVRGDFIAFLCFSRALPEAKFPSSLLEPFYESSEGLWSI